MPALDRPRREKKNGNSSKKFSPDPPQKSTKKKAVPKQVTARKPRVSTNVAHLLTLYLEWCKTKAVADALPGDGEWKIQGRNQTPQLSKQASEHLEDLHNWRKGKPNDEGSSVVTSSPSGISHSGDPVCLLSLEDLDLASRWNGIDHGLSDYGVIMASATTTKMVLDGDNGPLFYLDALHWLLHCPDAMPRPRQTRSVWTRSPSACEAPDSRRRQCQCSWWCHRRHNRGDQLRRSAPEAL